MRGRKPKFSAGDKVVGKEGSPASFKGRTGTVVHRGPGKSEYGVEFADTARVEYVESSWLVPIAKTARLKRQTL